MRGRHWQTFGRQAASRVSLWPGEPPPTRRPLAPHLLQRWGGWLSLVSLAWSPPLPGSNSTAGVGISFWCAGLLPFPLGGLPPPHPASGRLAAHRHAVASSPALLPLAGGGGVATSDRRHNGPRLFRPPATNAGPWRGICHSSWWAAPPSPRPPAMTPLGTGYWPRPAAEPANPLFRLPFTGLTADTRHHARAPPPRPHTPSPPL